MPAVHPHARQGVHAQRPPLTEADLLAAATSAIADYCLSDVEVASQIGSSVPTAINLRRGVLPKHPRLLEGVRSFVRRARFAASRVDLGLRP